MTEVEIEYCVPCGLLEDAIDTQRAILSEFGQELDAVKLRTGHGGVFKIHVDGDEIHDGKEEGYDEPAILAEIGDRL